MMKNALGVANNLRRNLKKYTVPTKKSPSLVYSLQTSPPTNSSANRKSGAITYNYMKKEMCTLKSEGI